MKIGAFEGLFTENKKVVIDINDSKSIAEALTKIVEQAEDILKSTENAVKKLCEAGETKAKELCPVKTGELRDSITHSVETDEGNGIVTGTITAGSDHAMYVEFGTGIMGEASGYPGELDGWQYDYRNVGWKGHAAKPYMYPTARYLEDNVKNILGGKG